MKKLLSIAAVVGMGCTAPAFAGEDSSCHFHGKALAKQETVVSCAATKQQQLVASGKLDRSWQGVKAASTEQVDGEKGKEWKVTYRNAAAADKAKGTLYMYFTPQGNFIAANFTGK
ncbi:MAG: DUF6488 family protein [Rubrivivax sp.]